MTGSFDRDPLDDLRRANPAAADRLPSASLARVQARVLEATAMNDEPASLADRARRLPRPALAGAVGLLGVAVVAIAFLLFGRGGVPGSGPGPVAGSCVQLYSLDTLRQRSFAFDGTVTAIAGDEVTFAVADLLRGSIGSTVTLTATGMTGTAITSAGGPTLQVGGRYLVAGEDHFAWSCGFTQPYDASVAAQWRQAFGR